MGIELTGRRIRLRDFASRDREAFVSFASDEAMFEFMTFRYDTHHQADSQFDWLLDRAKREVRRDFILAIERPDDSCLLGMAGIEEAGDEAAEFGWYLLSEHWGHGYAPEASELLLRFGFTEMGRSRLLAKCDPDNHRSRRAIEKSGLTLMPGVINDVPTWRGTRPRIWFEIDRAAWERGQGVRD